MSAKYLSLLYSPDLKGIRLAPAYDLVSTAVYGNSTREMALSIGGNYLLDTIDRGSFEQEAGEDGLGVKMAMQRFDRLAADFEKALQKASDFLAAQGFSQAPDFRERILKNGGIRVLKG